MVAIVIVEIQRCIQPKNFVVSIGLEAQNKLLTRNNFKNQLIY